MKIAIITCHAVYNYGAALQAFALQTYLKSIGQEPMIIDYRPDYLSRRYNFWYCNPKSRLYSLFKISRVFYFPFALYNYYCKQMYRRVKPFRNFENQYLDLTNKKYLSNEALSKDCPEFDSFFAGSDQIWNTFLKNGNDPAFFLDFVPLGKKRIAYAASFGSNQLLHESIPNLKKWLAKIDNISVRESSGVNLLKQIDSIGIQVLDPVFLLSIQDWKKLPIETINEDYIFVYDLSENNEDIAKFAKWLSRKCDYKIISVNDRKVRKYADKNINNAGPLEFLSYLNSAKYVVTTSFHASAFSLIFGKELYTFSNKGANNSNRIAELLDSVGLTDRFNPSLKKHESIDYNAINLLKQQKIEFAKQFINDSLKH